MPAIDVIHVALLSAAAVPITKRFTRHPVRPLLGLRQLVPHQFGGEGGRVSGAHGARCVLGDAIANRDQMRVIDHGFDNQIGSKSLSALRELREDETGGYYEVDLDDTSFNRDLLPGFRRGAYGASFRMHVKDDQWNDKPTRSNTTPTEFPSGRFFALRWPSSGLLHGLQIRWLPQSCVLRPTSSTPICDSAIKAPSRKPRAANIEFQTLLQQIPGRASGSEHDSELKSCAVTTQLPP